MELPPFDPLNRRAAELRAQGHHVISLGQAVPFFGPPAAALDAARAALNTPDVNRYVTDPGLPVLREALAARLSESLSARLCPDDMLITAGANHAFTLALTTFVNPGDEVVLVSPYFSNHQMAVVALGALPVEAPVADTSGFRISWVDLEPHITSRTRAVVLCNPSNPTGAPVSSEAGRRIVAEAAARGIVLISDETYMDFVYEGSHWSALSEPRWRENVVVIGTFSKSFGMMGWRVGFMVADAAACAQAVKIQDEMIICAPVISQIAAEAAVRESWSHARRFHDELRRRRSALAEGLAHLPGVEWVPGPAGLFAFVGISGCGDSRALAHALLEEAHVVTIPGAVFGAAGEGFLRLSYGYAGTEDLTEAVTRLRRVLGAAVVFSAGYPA
jgi:aminotransferase